ncbi:hypothetical protein FRC07_006284 [Ceratobasidium sp. 392]|nr:hypothetical protein FRC07_006284 [Ceratobasidium sp. 392]
MSDSQPIRVAIIGAGIGGITAAIALQTQLNFYDYTIYEMAEGVGGTWRANTYPGCVCDVPSHWYSHSTEPNPNWSMMFSGQAEIQAYWERIACKHNIEPRIEFSSEVLGATWDDAARLYTITLRDVRSKETRKVKAHVVVSAVGVFHKPKFPDISGRDKFKGASMHSKIWDHGVHFSGKKVAVIGNGRSGVQIVPALSEDPSVQIVQFCRTPTWFLAKPQAAVPARMRWIFRNVPLCEKLFRWLLAFAPGVALRSTPFTLAGKMDHGQHRCADNENRLASIQMVTSQVPEKYHQAMIPKFPMGCKPNIIDPGYLAALQRPNIQLEWDSIKEVTESGIITNSGKKYDLDVICYATGFDIEGSRILDVTGVNGQLMRDYYKEEGGPTAYMGTTTPGFPNWFTLLGPNIVNDHASLIYVEEVQANYIIQLIQPVIQGKAKSFVPKADATRAYNSRIQDQLSHTVLNGGCVSLYRAGSSSRLPRPFSSSDSQDRSR